MSTSRAAEADDNGCSGWIVAGLTALAGALCLFL